MKGLILSCMLLFSSGAFAQYVIINPTSGADNQVSTSSDIVGLTINNTGPGAYDDALDAISSNGFGAYLISSNSFGVFASSYASTSAYFSSGASNNNSPTMVLQNVGEAANLLEFQAVNSAVMASVGPTGEISALSGLKLPATGSCDAAHRRNMKVVEGGSGVADALQVCLKDAGGSYSWVTK